MEGTTSIAKTVLSCHELAEVLGGLGYRVVVKPENDTSLILLVDGNIELGEDSGGASR